MPGRVPNIAFWTAIFGGSFMGVGERVLIGKTIWQKTWCATPTTKEINLTFLFSQNPQNYKDPVASNSPREAPSTQIQSTSAIIRPGASPGLPTSGNSSRAHFEAVFSPQKFRFPFDGAIFGPQTSITPKCVGDFELISS